MNQLSIKVITEETVDAAIDVINAGFLEYFGVVKSEFNPDLYTILETYKPDGNIFLVGTINGEVVVTGALKKENVETSRIVRMSVSNKHRKKGYGTIMLKELEKYAKNFGYRKIVLETNKEWQNPIKLYKSHGYIFSHVEENQVHFWKTI
ncbi:GNAT superfamily N-acetyltransferase [Salirhabdus euzebyi]|uniref:GNAT superfamily N-acetyltransferase n=1 Tax=Salirhabdus euzebyi TaxID=394506 RepID=A0A841Q6H6_9BACI|nr:GNAT family N-acetyltransferase [Salirhabdus euzebyi]MBB6454119.1 GNAT superfamily N-acetyltransferase [Salirhabdus euzebyi]